MDGNRLDPLQTDLEMDQSTQRRKSPHTTASELEETALPVAIKELQMKQPDWKLFTLTKRMLVACFIAAVMD